jgi:hypothetical protein
MGAFATGGFVASFFSLGIAVVSPPATGNASGAFRASGEGNTALSPVRRSFKERPLWSGATVNPNTLFTKKSCPDVRDCSSSILTDAKA